MADNVKKISALEKLKHQKKILEARIHQVEARGKMQLRKEDTRRKILMGAFMMEKLKTEGGLDALYLEMDGFLTRNSDRKLFGLKMLETT